MAGHRITTRDDVNLDPAATAVIDAYLADLARQLPAHAPLADDIVAELRSDLVEATQALVRCSVSPPAAAWAATTEFGDAAEVAEAFRPELVVRHARRIGLTLFVTGPLIGACWLASLLLASSGESVAWRWLPLAIAPALLIGAPATAIAVASSGRLARWLRPSAGLTGVAVTVAGVAAGVGDIMLLAVGSALLMMPIPAPSPLVVFAAAASLTRLIFVTRTLFRSLGLKRTLAPPT
jgi:hypothetical protein